MQIGCPVLREMRPYMTTVGVRAAEQSVAAVMRRVPAMMRQEYLLDHCLRGRNLHSKVHTAVLQGAQRWRVICSTEGTAAAASGMAQRIAAELGLRVSPCPQLCPGS
jgi:hypothetical protein